MKRYDERDNIFSRMSLKVGSKNYNEYYEQNPEKKETDDEIRNMPGLMSEGSRQFDPHLSPMGISAFKFLHDIKPLAEKETSNKKVKISAKKASKIIKEYARYYGADLVGITNSNKEFYYSHRGRANYYGDEIEEFHKYAIVFAVEMDKEMINTAPRTEECVEVTRGYVKAALIGMMLSYYIRELGYPARNHMDGNYLLIAPPLAVKAGLGEIGKSGLLISKKYGPRVRLGVVSTELELIPDKENSFGLSKFCNICNNCSKLCPAKAIPSKLNENKSNKSTSYIDSDKCYKMWRKVGTDCGICLASCPFSHYVDLELINQMKNSNNIMKRIMDNFKQKYKTRPINKDSRFK